MRGSGRLPGKQAAHDCQLAPCAIERLASIDLPLHCLREFLIVAAHNNWKGTITLPSGFGQIQDGLGRGFVFFDGISIEPKDNPELL